VLFRSEVVTPTMKGRPGTMLVLDSKRGLLFGTSAWTYEPYGSTWLGLWAAKTGQTQVRSGLRTDIKATTADAKSVNIDDSAAGSWPGWRGPNGDGKSPLKGIRKDWTGGLKKVWEVTGLSPYDCTWSPPVVQGDKLIVMGKHGYLDEVLCFNADQGGQPLWIAELPGGGGDGWASGPHVSPFISGDKVYVCYANSRYGCLSMKDGRLLWKKAYVSGGHAPGHPTLVWEDLAILTGVVRPETGKRGTISAFNKDTGEWVWTYGEDNKRQDLTWTAPVKLTINGKDQLVFNTTGFACGLDPRPGKPRWEKIPDPELKEEMGTYTDPLTDGKTVVVVIGLQKAPVQYQRCALQIENGVAKELWSTPGIWPGWSDPILKDGYLYLFLSDGLYAQGNSGFGCLDMKTGQEKWSKKKTGCGSVVEVDGCLLCLTYGGDLWLLDPSPDGFKKITEWKGAVKIQPWWRHTGSPAGVAIVPEVPLAAKIPGAPCWTVPVIARGKLYLRYSDTLTCYDLMPGP
jgi:outer membrane protein assembly factor BamB